MFGLIDILFIIRLFYFHECVIVHMLLNICYDDILEPHFKLLSLNKINLYQISCEKQNRQILGQPPALTTTVSFVISAQILFSVLILMIMLC